MALTPEDVVNKRFQPTKFREGYDQDEVDDFLDEVVVELRRLNQENEELRQRLIQGESRINQLQQAGGQGAPAMAAPPMAAPIPAPAPVAPPAPAFNAGMEDQGNTNNLLQLARTLHEQHVREGIEKRDALIAEGHEQAARVVQEAEQQQLSAISGLEQQKAALEQELEQQKAALGQELAQQKATLEQEKATLEQERQNLEYRIDELRNFERDYRLKLKGYIEGQLRELDATQVSTPTQQPAYQTAPQQAAPPAPSLQTAPQQFPQLPYQREQQEQPLQQAAPPAFGGLNDQQPPQPQQVPQGYPGFGGN